MIKIDDKNVQEFNKKQAIREVICEYLSYKYLLVPNYCASSFYVHKNTVFNKIKAFIRVEHMREIGNALFYVNFGFNKNVTFANIDSNNSSKETLEAISEFCSHLSNLEWNVNVILTKDKCIPCKIKRK